MDVPTNKIKELVQTLMAITERIQKEKQTLNGSDLVRTPDPKARGAVRTLSLSGKR